MKLAIINSGGNGMSLKKILKYSGFDPEIVNSKENKNSYDEQILPGIGSFDNAIDEIKKIWGLDFCSGGNEFKCKKEVGRC